MNTGPFADLVRFDAVNIVQGRTRYSADVQVADVLHAMTVPATMGKGRIVAIDVTDAMAVPGVIRVLTADDTPPPPPPAEGAPPPPPMLETTVAYRGQPIALVVAETLEGAVEGAEAVRVTYEAEAFVSRFEDADSPREDAEEAPIYGDADAAYASAVTRHEATYITTANHHNPIELLSTTAVWSGGRLTLYLGTQGSSSVKNAVAQCLQIDRNIVDVISSNIGGGFGQRGEVPRQCAVVAQAARLVGRPVKLVIPRTQIFHTIRFRPYVQHTIRLGADADGQMVSAHYDSLQQNSRNGRYSSDWYHAGPSKVYGIPNYLGTAGDLRIDTHTPGQMRAPFEHPSAFAFESAIDEMAFAVGRDPVEFRMAHDTQIDRTTGNRLSSRYLNQCLSQGAERLAGHDGRFNRSP